MTPIEKDHCSAAVLLACVLFMLFLCTRLCGFLTRFGLLLLAASLFVLCVVDAHAGELVLHGLHRVAQQHALLRGAHDMSEVTRSCGAEARPVAAVTYRLRDTVWAAVDMRHGRRKECCALRAKLSGRAMMCMTVHLKGLADVLLLFRYVIWNRSRLLFLRQEPAENTH